MRLQRVSMGMKSGLTLQRPRTARLKAFTLNGPMTVYWNRSPPSGSDEFPLGTIIVKQNDPGATTPQIFAMVKREGGYNASGAKGWEFFELQAADDQSVVILWRGVGPPVGESYGSDPNTCNNCHSQAGANDFVWSSALQLSSF